MNEKMRRVEVWRGDEWVQTQIELLKIGDKFRMFEPGTGESVALDTGETVFTVIEKPWFGIKTHGDMGRKVGEEDVWSVEIEENRQEEVGSDE